MNIFLYCFIFFILQSIWNRYIAIDPIFVSFSFSLYTFRLLILRILKSIKMLYHSRVKKIKKKKKAHWEATSVYIVKPADKRR